jgi:hypothetical protein
MAKPQELPKPLPADIAQLKTLIDERLVGLGVEKNAIRVAKEDIDEYHRHISALREEALKVLGLADYDPKVN